ncbi:MAG: MOSC N-terminal beta barrel domain-containing protein [Pseudonocardia sp.]|uniref:MOSC domain-containing protein n=1 Tax=unclassified Pseudonocardia TaxID=2619320 RepID=UPI00086F275A|nr:MULTISPECIES: MOSC N-terminal beta barrel domain-containing protein [unclassified Pseudonocardia]MBN9111762.1 MOSC N-terminal beta barrel domain-containing protein [Pseudonocardia sp.]ODU99727.1 MAG: molybdenum cofactor biosysynthesis protein [Pseudonocardia sp. SCN 73-27]
MQVTTMWRYPVKSMLGERISEGRVDAAGLRRDRGVAIIDAESGLVATAKHPRLWRDLLKYSATVDGGQVVITSPAGWTLDAASPDVDGRLSAELGRVVHVATDRPDGATVERPDPEDVLAEGVEAAVPAATLEIGMGTPGTTFVDYAPLHLITSATLDEVGVEHVRYRPNLVLETPPGTPPFVENDWVGRELHVGEWTVLRISVPTPRCSVPTLEHGDLPRSPRAVRAVLTRNRVDVPGFGVLPCAGCYAEVVQGGTIRVGDEVTLR